MSYRIRYRAPGNRTTSLVDSFETRAEAEAAMNQERDARSRDALSAARGGPGSSWWVEEVGLASKIGRYAAIATAAALLITFIVWARHHPLVYCALGFEGNCREPTWVKVEDVGTDVPDPDTGLVHVEAEINTETFKRAGGTETGDTVTFDERVTQKYLLTLRGATTASAHLITVEMNVSLDCKNQIRTTNALISLNYQTIGSDGRWQDNPGMTAAARQVTAIQPPYHLPKLNPDERWACHHVPG
jgi:hypothetical protein